MHPYVVDLASCASMTIDEVGGKAKALGEMAAAGYPVPRGIVITTTCQRAAAKPTRSGNGESPSDTWVIAGELESQMRQAISNLEPRHGFMVRSSAVGEDGASDAWAGIFDSYVSQGVDEAIGSVVKCWSSLFAQTANYYWRTRATRMGLAMGVIVQERILPEVSGVLFSHDPLSGHSDHIIVEIVDGACEQLVSGRLTPDRYVIDRCDYRIVDRQVVNRRKAKITHRNLLTLAAYAAPLEQLSGCAVDIEWGYADGQYWFFQRRPITAASGYESELEPDHGRDALQFWWSDCSPLWRLETRYRYICNRKDILWNRISLFSLVITGGSAAAFLSVEDARRCIGRGQRHFDEASLRELDAKAVELQSSYQSTKERLSRIQYSAISSAEQARIFCEVVELFGLLASYYRSTGAEETALFEEELGYFLDLDEIEALDAAYPDEEVQEERRSFELCRKGTDSESESALIEHAKSFPWLGINAQSQAQLVALLRTRLDSEPPTCVESAQAGGGDTTLPQRGDDGSIALAYSILKRVRSGLKLCWAGIDFMMLDFFEHLAHEFGQEIGTLLSYYRVDEILDLITDGTTLDSQEIDARREIQALVGRGEVLTYASGQAAKELLAELSIAADPAELVGTVACRQENGTVSGTVILLVCNDTDSADAARRIVSHQHIVVTSMMQFNTIDVLTRAGGVITDEGGVLSHAAIIAREYKIPTIVGTKRATSELTDGQQVTMDLITGAVLVNL